MSDSEPTGRPGRHLLLVAGQGRSGTSLFTGIMQELGFHVPQPEVVADRTNPRGFGEPQWVVDYHQRMLQRLGIHPSDARPSSWATTGQMATRGAVRAELRTWLEKQLAENPRLIVKDPRTVWFLGLWREAARDLDLPLAVVTMLRHPAEVVLSKQTAYGGRLDTTARMAGWVNGMLFTERATRDLSRTFVRYQALLEDWTQETSRADTQLGTQLVPNAIVSQIRAAANLVDPDLHRSVSSLDEFGLPDQLCRLALDAWEQLSTMADDPVISEEDKRATSLDELRAEYVRYYEECEAVARSSVLAAEANARRAKPAAAKASGKPTAEPPPAAGQSADPSEDSGAPPRRRMVRARGLWRRSKR